MMSEWMEEVPEDLAEGWLMVPCPRGGKRRLVVAAGGWTKAYNKSGRFCEKFPSGLPGGARKQHASRKCYTILDCLHDQTAGIYYVLDIMCWGGHHVYENNTEFRFFWVHSKLTQECEVAVKTKPNPHLFIPLPYYGCDHGTLCTAIGQHAREADGLLFFCKETPYTPGTTPLVVWLTPDLLGPVLGIADSGPSEQQQQQQQQGFTHPSGFGPAFDHQQTVDFRMAPGWLGAQQAPVLAPAAGPTFE